MENNILNSKPGDNYRQFDDFLREPLSLGDWFITILITSIPLVGFIMLFVWGFSSGTNINKANWAKAMLIWYVIGFVLAGIILGFVGLAFFANQFNY
jgi:hypothetical protein